jgi:hypothetical protein
MASKAKPGFMKSGLVGKKAMADQPKMVKTPSSKKK